MLWFLSICIMPDLKYPTKRKKNAAAYLREKSAVKATCNIGPDIKVLGLLAPTWASCGVALTGAVLVAYGSVASSGAVTYSPVPRRWRACLSPVFWLVRTASCIFLQLLWALGLWLRRHTMQDTLVSMLGDGNPVSDRFSNANLNQVKCDIHLPMKIHAVCPRPFPVKLWF